MHKTAARELLRQFDLKGLFLNELGWDDHDGSSFFISMAKTPRNRLPIRFFVDFIGFLLIGFHLACKAAAC